MKKEILIYCPIPNPKVKYVFDFIFEQYDIDQILFIQDRNKFSRDQSSIKLNYSEEAIRGSIQIPCSLYFGLANWQGAPDIKRYLLDKNGHVSFDFVAAIFFLLSRAEEYSQEDRDIHNRYKPSHSILSKEGLLDIPVIDYWVEDFMALINDKCLINLKSRSSYKFYSTIDIDHIYAYKSKPLYVRAGSLARDILKGNFQRIKDRRRDIDPYDTFDYLLDVHKGLNIDPSFFVLTSKRTSYDKSLAPAHPLFIKKIKEITHKEIGIHPSYYAQDSTQIISEKKILEEIIAKPIVQSRFHYIRMSLPDSYQELIKAGIKKDYSMAYPSVIGFRSGTSRSYRWYDISEDQCTDLEIIPFQLMDVTLRNYMSLSTQEAIEKSKKIIDQIKQVKGSCTLIWHNSSFYDTEGWAGWKEVYEQLLAYAKA